MNTPSSLGKSPNPAPGHSSGPTARGPQIRCLMVVYLVSVVCLMLGVGWTLGLFTMVIGTGLAWLVVRALDRCCGLLTRKEARWDTNAR